MDVASPSAAGSVGGGASGEADGVPSSDLTVSGKKEATDAMSDGSISSLALSPAGSAPGSEARGAGLAWSAHGRWGRLFWEELRLLALLAHIRLGAAVVGGWSVEASCDSGTGTGSDSWRSGGGS